MGMGSLLCGCTVLKDAGSLQKRIKLRIVLFYPFITTSRMNLSFQKQAINTLSYHHSLSSLHITTLEDKPVLALKSSFNQWIRSISSEERFKALMMDKRKKRGAAEQEECRTSLLTTKRKDKIQGKTKIDHQDKLDRIFQKSKDVQLHHQHSQLKPYLLKEKQKEKLQLQNTQKIVAVQALVQEQWARLAEELQETSDKISQESNSIQERRVIAFERIKYLLAYSNIKIQLFGSCASGIATKNSDIDIAINSSILDYFPCPDPLRLKVALDYLRQIFSSQPCIVSVNLIASAAIPVIKLKIDTSIQFLNENYGQVYQTLNKSHNSGVIQADITIETLNHLSQSNHLGIISTQAINEWLKPLVIIMKELFSLRGFNNTYKGGLNTFSMIILFVGYILHAKLEKQTNAAKVLFKILTFYSTEFDEKDMGVDVLNRQNGKIFFLKKEYETPESLRDSREKADLELLDPKSNRKNITRKCYAFSYIKKYFGEIKEKCFEPRLRLDKQTTARKNAFWEFIEAVKNQK